MECLVVTRTTVCINQANKAFKGPLFLRIKSAIEGKIFKRKKIKQFNIQKQEKQHLKFNCDRFTNKHLDSAYI